MKKIAFIFHSIKMKSFTLFLLTSMLWSCYSAESQKTGKEGKLMPSFKLLLPDSLTYIDTKDIPTGKPIVLFYYSPYCTYSKAQMKEMLEEINSINDVQLYVITSWPFVSMKNFYSIYHLNTYPNIIAGWDAANFFGNYFKVTGVPCTAIYTSDKKLTKVYEGQIFTKQIIKSIQN